MTEAPEIQVGAPLTPEELADYEQLRALVSPEVGLALLDDFAKWLFAIAAVAATVGTGFEVSGANTLTGSGNTMFACAVVAAAVSVALAASARLPLPIMVNRYSPDSLSRGVATVGKVRAVLLTVAVVLFAAALILAGLAPVFS